MKCSFLLQKIFSWPTGPVSFLKLAQRASNRLKIPNLFQQISDSDSTNSAALQVYGFWLITSSKELYLPTVVKIFVYCYLLKTL